MDGPLQQSSTKDIKCNFFLSYSLMFVVLYCGYGDLFFKAVPCQRYFGGNIVMGANFLRKNVTFSATLFVAIKHPFWAHICKEKNNKNVPCTQSFR